MNSLILMLHKGAVNFEQGCTWMAPYILLKEIKITKVIHIPFHHGYLRYDFLCCCFMLSISLYDNLFTSVHPEARTQTPLYQPSGFSAYCVANSSSPMCVEMFEIGDVSSFSTTSLDSVTWVWPSVNLTPVDGGLVNAFAPPWDTCIHWESSQDPGRGSLEIRGRFRLARIKIDDTLLVGK